MMWLILGTVLLIWLMVKWTILAVWYLALGIVWVGVAALRLMTNRWPDAAR